MTEKFRTQSGGRIDRTRPLRFTWDGVNLTGREGDTLASALIANGIHLAGRSFKYHRPRGILAAGPEEPNALVRVTRPNGAATPNLRAPVVELYEGLAAESQNRSPSLAWDWGEIADLAPWLLPAGFYYKTFLWPRRAWFEFFEPRIRAAAGLGRAPEGPDPDHYTHCYAHADVLVIGAGPAGLSAALAAAQAGADTILCDEQAEPGGSLLSDPAARIENLQAADWIARTTAAFRAAGGRLLTRTTGFAHFPHNMVGLVERLTDHLATPDPAAPRERMWFVRAREVVFAQGSIERPLVFAGNDRPGIMLAHAARSYATRYAALPGRNAVLVTAHDAAYRAAFDLQDAGCAIAAIADLRESAGPAGEAARARGIRVMQAARPAGTAGRLRVSAIDFARGADLDERIPCDLVLMSGGFTPSVHLFSQARGKLAFDPATGAFLPATSPERVRTAGSGRGVFALEDVLADGAQAGEAAARGLPGRPVPPHDPGGGLVGIAPGTPRGSNRRFVDFQNDVTDKDLLLATREGFRSIEHVKRYTTTGMATDQGKTSNLNALGIVSAALDRPMPAVGLTTFRMPYTPTSFGAFAGHGRGDLFDPIRTTPIHAWAQGKGAVFEDVGNWKRARYFPHAGEDMDSAVARECLAVRNGVGLFDASTLGKIEVCGPDSAEFLERMYVNAWKKLAPGRCRYGIMLRESGFVMDDGVIGRLAPDRFHVTTTTGGAASVLAFMEDYLQTEWPDLDVWLTSVTEHWAVIAVQGPKSRDVIAPMVEGVDFAAFPHMSVAQARICGVPGRLFRVSFTGELGFELNVPASHGLRVWEEVAKAGAAHGILPYGTEAMHVLRAEKGYIIVGQDSDGTATPDDLGLSWAVGRAKRDFVGKRSIDRPEMQGPGRKQLVGLETVNGRNVLIEGAQIVSHAGSRESLGHVTSAYHSAALGKPIALAMLQDGRARKGQTLIVPFGPEYRRGNVAVRVTDPVFLDPKGERLDG